ncbi:MAG TPA: dual specificity protein phosphatase [Roseiflexaceae bacterium]|nr:dual specificity protein phosphatase [Roseiflexaceae bacterium]
MPDDTTPSFYVHGSSAPVPLRSPRIFWSYAATQWRRIFGLNVSRIDDTLFVGGEFRAAQWPLLRAMGIRAVLSLQAERADEFDGPPPERALRLPVPDFHPPSVAQLHEACAFIRAAHADGLPVMVHCHAGVGRAPLTAGAYLVTRGHSAESAIERIRLCRPIIGLNRPQQERLAEWERLQLG